MLEGEDRRLCDGGFSMESEDWRSNGLQLKGSVLEGSHSTMYFLTFSSILGKFC